MSNSTSVCLIFNAHICFFFELTYTSAQETELFYTILYNIIQITRSTSIFQLLFKSTKSNIYIYIYIAI